MNALEAALAYHARGFVPLPLRPREKRPIGEGWEKYRPDEAAIRRDFANGVGVGLLLGAPSRGLADVDLDAPEARALADGFLPETEAVSGRVSSRRSHRWYLAPGVSTARYRDPVDGGTIVELRSDGAQTVAPPSVHPSGELVVWESDGEPARVDAAELRVAAPRLAACALVARHWPTGSRHDAALALAGMLLRGGWSREDTEHFVCRAAEAARDEEWRDRVRAVADTVAALARDEQATGAPTLARLLGERVVDRLREWLGLRRESAEVRDADWPVRRELPSPLVPVPALEADLLPDALRPWISDVAERMQVPLDFAAVPALVAAGAAVGRQLAIQPRRHDRTWVVVPNLWGAIIARAGALKSPTMREMLRPLNRLAAHAREQHAAGRPAALAQETEFAARREALRNELRGAAKGGSRRRGAEARSLEEIRGDLLALEREAAAAERPARRYVTSDPTPEKLVDLLAENPRGLLLVRDELAGWLRSLERQGREGDRELYLEAWAGDGSYTIDRIKRGTQHVDGMCLSILGSIQPGKLERYVAECIAGGAGDDGLLQRLQLVVYPDVPRDWQPIDRPADESERTRAVHIFGQLDRIDPDAYDAEVRDDGPPVVRFADEGQGLWDEWHAALERRLRSGEIEHEALASHLAKFRSLCPTLALIDHALAVADGASPGGGIPARCVWRAIRWCEHLEAHARRVYGGVLHRDLHAARALARRIERGELRDGVEVRWIYRHGWTGLSTREDVDAALAVLHDAGWVRLEERKTGGRPSDVLRLHPDLARGADT